MINQETLKIIRQLNKGVVGITLAHIDMTGSLTSAYLFSYLRYLSDKAKHCEFPKTDKELCGELRMSLTKLQSAKKLLVGLGLVKIVRKSIPARSYYTLDLTKYNEKSQSKD